MAQPSRHSIDVCVAWLSHGHYLCDQPVCGSATDPANARAGVRSRASSPNARSLRLANFLSHHFAKNKMGLVKIGRASCRERVYYKRVGGWLSTAADDKKDADGD